MIAPPAISIAPLGTGKLFDRHWRMIEEIFYLSSSRQGFDNPDEKLRFFDRWTGYYRLNEPRHFLLAIAPGGRVAGYLSGCTDSRAARRLYSDIPYYAVFEDLFETYPAHLHVNCHPTFRGRGIGTELVEAFTGHCRRADLAGVHLVTSPGARNVGFYRRCGFDFSLIRRWRGTELLFLARALRPARAGLRQRPRKAR